MKISCKSSNIFITGKDGESLNLKEGVHEIDDAIAEKLIARGLVTEPGKEPEDEVEDESKDEKSSTKKTTK